MVGRMMDKGCTGQLRGVICGTGTDGTRLNDGTIA